MKIFNRYCLLLIGLLLPSISMAADAVKVEQAWARSTAPGQEVGAAYLNLESTTDATLTAVTSPSAGSIEIHRMSMNKGVMEMRKLDALPLPAGKVVKLEPGGYHLMLFDLKKSLKAGDQLEFSLRIKDKSGKSRIQQVRLPVRSGD